MRSVATPRSEFGEDTLAQEQDGKEQEQEARVRKGVPAVVFVLVGAVAGGAGMVWLSPTPAPTTETTHAPDVRVFDHPDPMEFLINPISDRGSRTAMIHFLFSYRAATEDVEGKHEADGGGEGGHAGTPALDDLPPVPREIKLNWNRAVSRCIEVLSSQRVDTLMDPDGKRMVKRMLIDELSATLFPDGKAKVDDILWTKFVVQ